MRKKLEKDFPSGDSFSVVPKPATVLKERAFPGVVHSTLDSPELPNTGSAIPPPTLSCHQLDKHILDQVERLVPEAVLVASAVPSAHTGVAPESHTEVQVIFVL